MKRLLVMVSLSATLTVLAACGDQTVSTGSVSTDPDALVVRVEHTGGFVPVETIFTNLPVTSIHADGRVITQGPQVMIYPGPAVPNLLERTLDAEGLATVLDAADDAGLLTAPIDYGQPPVADAPDTVVTIVADGKTYTQSANALGDFGSDNTNLTPDQVEAREELSQFVDSMTDLETLVGAEHISAEEPYEITGWRLRATAVDELPAGDPAPTVVPWPATSLPLATIGECTAVTGDQASEVSEIMGDANQLTYFSDAGETYQVLARPLLPDETGC